LCCMAMLHVRMRTQHGIAAQLSTGAPSWLQRSTADTAETLERSNGRWCCSHSSAVQMPNLMVVICRQAMAALKGLYEGTLAERLELAKTARAEAAAAAARAEAAEAEVLTLRVQHEGMSAPLAQVSGPAIRLCNLAYERLCEAHYCDI
jgi:hypothetical protein